MPLHDRTKQIHRMHDPHDLNRSKDWWIWFADQPWQVSGTTWLIRKQLLIEPRPPVSTAAAIPITH